MWHPELVGLCGQIAAMSGIGMQARYGQRVAEDAKLRRRRKAAEAEAEARRGREEAARAAAEAEEEEAEARRVVERGGAEWRQGRGDEEGSSAAERAFAAWRAGEARAHRRAEKRLGEAEPWWYAAVLGPHGTPHRPRAHMLAAVLLVSLAVTGNAVAAVACACAALAMLGGGGEAAEAAEAAPAQDRRAADEARAEAAGLAHAPTRDAVLAALAGPRVDAAAVRRLLRAYEESAAFDEADAERLARIEVPRGAGSSGSASVTGLYAALDRL